MGRGDIPLSTWEGIGRQNSVNSRPIWSMELVQGQSSLHKETLSQKTKPKQKDHVLFMASEGLKSLIRVSC